MKKSGYRKNHKYNKLLTGAELTPLKQNILEFN